MANGQEPPGLITPADIAAPLPAELQMQLDWNHGAPVDSYALQSRPFIGAYDVLPALTDHIWGDASDILDTVSDKNPCHRLSKFCLE